MYTFTGDQINPDALQQTEVWYDKKGNLHYINELPFSYCRNIIATLLKKGHHLNAHRSPLMGALKERLHETREAFTHGRD